METTEISEKWKMNQNNKSEPSKILLSKDYLKSIFNTSLDIEEIEALANPVRQSLIKRISKVLIETQKRAPLGHYDKLKSLFETLYLYEIANYIDPALIVDWGNIEENDTDYIAKCVKEKIKPLDPTLDLGW